MEPTIMPPAPTTPTPVVQTSSKLPWILVVVLLLILIGGGGYLFGKTFGVSKLDIVLPTPTPPIDMTNDAIGPTTTSMSSLKTQTVKKLDNVSFSSFIINYPDGWSPSENRQASSLNFDLMRTGQVITIFQAPTDGGVCLFKDSPDFQGPSDDLRNVEYTQIETYMGTARYYLKNDTHYNFCWLSHGFYQGLSPVGVISFDGKFSDYPGGAKEIENIILSIKPI